MESGGRERRGELNKLHEEYNTLSLAHADLTNERDALTADLAAERSAHLADNDPARLFREQYLAVRRILLRSGKILMRQIRRLRPVRQRLMRM